MMDSVPTETIRTTATTTRERTGLTVAVQVLFALVALRFLAAWANSLADLHLPVLGSVGFTALFTAFSCLHAADRLGWPKAAVFLLVCAVVSWGFEAVGIATGLVYGPYHYGTRLGVKLGAVPVIIPLAWFMMIYASWVVADALLGVEARSSGGGIAARIVVAAMAMTAWDTVMDPGKALSGAWTWEQGGSYFGVPVHNFVGWLVTTITVYAVVELLFLRMPAGAREHRIDRLAGGLPILAYGLIALDAVVRPGLPALRVVALFGMGFIALLAVLRLLLTEPIAARR